jgi:hypothetical protein
LKRQGCPNGALFAAVKIPAFGALNGILHNTPKVVDNYQAHKNKPIGYPPLKNGF